MTSDIRELLRSAAEVEPSGLGVRAAMQRGVTLRWRRRVQIALPVAVAAAVLLAVVLPRVGSFVDAERISPVGPGQPQKAPSDVQDAQPDPRRTADPSEARDTRTTGTEPGTPGTALAPTQRSADCSPLIEDPAFDVSDSSIDILRSSISYRADTGALTLTHALRDIKPDPDPGDSTPGEGPFYDLRFAWDGVEYSAEAYTTASGEDEFSVMRAADRPTVGTSSAVNQIDHGNVTGRIDRVSDTVVLHVPLDEFNEAEKAASSSANRPATKELKVGSKLMGIRLVANPRGSSWSMNEHETDVGTADCDYVIGR
jgi:hypothetical protein